MTSGNGAAMSLVTHFETGLMSSGVLHYVLARLDCKHAAAVVMKSHRGACLKCNAEQELNEQGGTKCQACGHGSFTYTYLPDVLKEADRITKVGDAIECATCRSNRESEVRLEALDLSNIQYLRFDTKFGGRYLAYKRDIDSPTGVSLADTYPATPAIDAIIDRRRVCTMSPTEGRAERRAGRF